MCEHATTARANLHTHVRACVSTCEHVRACQHVSSSTAFSAKAILAHNQADSARNQADSAQNQVDLTWDVDCGEPHDLDDEAVAEHAAHVRVQVYPDLHLAPSGNRPGVRRARDPHAFPACHTPYAIRHTRGQYRDTRAGLWDTRGLHRETQVQYRDTRAQYQTPHSTPLCAHGLRPLLVGRNPLPAAKSSAFSLRFVPGPGRKSLISRLHVTFEHLLRLLGSVAPVQEALAVHRSEARRLFVLVSENDAPFRTQYNASVPGAVQRRTPLTSTTR
eukprot:882978-Rhodomonas_salina.1